MKHSRDHCCRIEDFCGTGGGRCFRKLAAENHYQKKGSIPAIEEATVCMAFGQPAYGFASPTLLTALIVTGCNPNVPRTPPFSYLYPLNSMKRFLPALLAALIITACNPNDTPQPQPLDLFVQWQTDAAGSILAAPGSDQWRPTSLSAAEMALFAPLDTVSLAGTTRPDSVKGPATYPYPNPFLAIQAYSWRFASNYNGACVLKYVLVDAAMNPVFRTWARLQAAPPVTLANIQFSLNIPAGRYRVYQSLSALGAPHFYQNWGNIEKQ